MELNAKKVKIEFDKKTNGRITRKDINWMQSLHSAGIYILLSPEENSVYVGQAKNVYARLEAHYNEDFIEPHFLEEKDRKSSYSRKILTRQDAEMYCCFLEGRNEYDYSNVTDLKKELKNLEGFMMDVMEYNGYKVVNYRKEKYNSSNLKGESLYEEDNIINLGDNIFKFGLGNYLNLQVHTNSHRVKSEIRANEEHRKVIERLEKENKVLINEITSLINKNTTLQEKVEKLKRYVNLHRNYLSKAYKRIKCYKIDEEVKKLIKEESENNEVAKKNVEMLREINEVLMEVKDIDVLFDGTVTDAYRKLCTLTTYAYIKISSNPENQKREAVRTFLEKQNRILSQLCNELKK